MNMDFIVGCQAFWMAKVLILADTGVSEYREMVAKRVMEKYREMIKGEN